MRHLPRALCSALLCLLALTACTADETEPAARPTAEPTPTATPEPTPAAETGDPVTVEVDYVDVQLLDNAVLRGQPQREPSEGVADAAVASAAAALERYLTTQFIAAETRFTAAGFTELVGEEAAASLDEEARRGVGELDLDVRRTDADPVAAQAVVLTDGDDLLSVTLVYETSVTATDEAGRSHVLHQQGRVLFPAQEGEAWRAEMLETTLEIPEEVRA